eukprot:TRINITY_DN11377_c0_g1_i1.p1 TRINITY_DN11377_c0_g1~~TRINITY_DN11377_c0_g1_i1.p1  ORF type:complete len:427 (-),score=71.65 TRINITY_DN11377_c0_g1_i1:45-1325(-)
MNPRVIAVFTILTLLGVLLVYYQKPFLLSFIDYIKESGWRGQVIYILLWQIVGLPFTFGYIPLSVSAGYLYSFFKGTVLVCIGSTTSLSTSFLLCRYLLAPFLSSHLTSVYPQLLNNINTGGWPVIFFIRLLPIPYGIVNGVMAMSNVSFIEYCVASTLGLLPWQLMWTWMGTRFGELGEICEGGGSGEKVIVILQGVVGVALAVLWFKGGGWWKKCKGVDTTTPVEPDIEMGLIETLGEEDPDIVSNEIKEEVQEKEQEIESQTNSPEEIRPDRKEIEKSTRGVMSSSVGAAGPASSLNNDETNNDNNSNNLSNSGKKKGHSRAKTVTITSSSRPDDAQKLLPRQMTFDDLDNKNPLSSSSDAHSNGSDGNHLSAGQSFLKTYIEQPLKKASSSNDLSTLMRMSPNLLAASHTPSPNTVFREKKA